MPSDLQIWATVASAGAAWIALFLSIINIRTSRKALRISEQQETRRRPSLVAYLQDGYLSVGAMPDARVYAFLVSLSNRSDSDNAVAEATLHVTYSKQGESRFTVKIPASHEMAVMLGGAPIAHLQVPTRIDAHQTVSGWCFFAVEHAILDRAKIEGLLVTFMDTHGGESSVEPLIIREISDDVQASGHQKDVPDLQ